MGTYCYVKAEPAVLERIALASAGTIDRISAVKREYLAKAQALEAAMEALPGMERLGYEARHALYEAEDEALAVIHPFAETLSLCDAIVLGKIHFHPRAYFLQGCDATKDPETMRQLIATQREKSCFNSLRVGGTDAEWVAIDDEHRALCSRVLVEIAAGNVESVYWG